MSLLVTPSGKFHLRQFELEKDFEVAVVSQVERIFGDHRIYVDCKRRIGAKGGKKSVPDAYLIDLSQPSEPLLYLVENELSSHELFEHIGVQLLQFSVSFSQSRRLVKQLLSEEILSRTPLKHRFETFLTQGSFRNLDHLLDTLVDHGKFRAIVIIDEETDDLHAVLNSLNFPVEIIEFRTYENEKGDRIYQFEPFLADVEIVPEVKRKAKKARRLSDLDTLVVPARPGGFERVFLGEHRWWAVRIHPSMAQQLKYIAAYQVKPLSAITCYAPIRSIEPWKDTGKVVVNFSEPAREIGPLKLIKKGRVKALQTLRYTTIEKLKSAKNLDDAF
jgi:hypothetical protein